MEILYKITCRINNRYYIGSTSHIERRLKTHILWEINKRSQHNELHEDIVHYGIENFDIEILEQSEDKIIISRLESNTIRNNAEDKLLYNKSIGASGRRVFYESDIIFIRQLYDKKELYIKDACEQYYKDIVSYRAFKKVWHGDTFKDIYYHVYTEENKAWHFAKGQSRPHEQNGRAKVTEKDVAFIRRCKRMGIAWQQVYNKRYKNILCSVAFKDIWDYKSWA